MKTLLPSLTLATIAFAPAAHAAAPLFAAAPLTDAELEEARGGFTLPGGIQVDIGAIISTSIDGVKVLTSQLRINDSGVTGSVDTASGITATVTGTGSTSPNVTQTVGEATTEVADAVGDLTAGLGSVTATQGAGTSTESTTGPTDAAAQTVTPGTTLADVAPSAAAAVQGITTSGNAGDIQVAGIQPSTTVDGTNYLTSTVTLTDALVRHSLGDSISSLVINTADNRTIDTQLIVNLRLDNVEPLSLGSVGFRIDAMGTDASQWRASH